MRFTQSNIDYLVAFLLGLFLQFGPAHAITLGQIDDFQDGTVQGWSGIPPINVPDIGPDGVGDNVLSATATGFNGPGSRLVVFNDSSTWTGDWTANGVTKIKMNVFNPNSFPLTLRLGIAGPGDSGGSSQGNKYVTSTGIVIPAHDHWHTVEFDVTAADLALLTGTDAANALTGVTQFRVIHNAATDWRGEAVAGTFLLDNIRAIPEPATVILAMGSLAMVLLSGRRRWRLGLISVPRAPNFP